MYIDNAVNEDNGLSARYLKHAFNLRASTRIVQKYLRFLGWRKIRTKYCQIVSRKNRMERLIFAQLCIQHNETFDHSIFIDESKVQIQKNANTRWYRPRYGECELIGRYKHESKINVIGGISRKGPTKLVLFDGTLNTNSFVECIEEFLVPFINDNYSAFHKLQMDNATCHASGEAERNLEELGINHFKTPALDLNSDLNYLIIILLSHRMF